MLDQIFANLADDQILEDVPQPWIFAMLSSVNTETAAEGRPVTLNAKSTIGDLKQAIQSLHTEAQFQILSRTFNRYMTDMKESPTLNESIRELEQDQLRNKLTAAAVYTFLGLISFFTVATVGIAIAGIEREVDAALGTALFSTLLEIFKFLYS